MLKKAMVSWCVAMGWIVLSFAQSQDISQQFISARSGLVNYLDGNPKVYRGLKETKTLSVKDQLRSGDQIRLGETELIEILLNPGSYLRIAGKAQLEVFRTSFDDMQFGVTQGMAIIELGVFNRKVHALQVSTPAGEVRILEQGLYRFEVLSPQQVYFSIDKRQALWVKDKKELATLKSGKRFSLGTSTGRNLQYAKLDKNQLDDFDLWSKRRAEFLVAANSRLSSWGTEMAHLNYGSRFLGGWAYNPFYNCYTFVPFSGSFFSPYGFAYRNYYWGYEPYYGRSGGGYYGGGGSGSSVPRSTSVETRRSVSTAPASPSSRVETGRSDTGSRSGAHDRISR